MYQNLQYGDPARGLRFSVMLSAVIGLTRIKKLRAKRLETKPELESRQGALFAYGRMLLESNSSMMLATVSKQDDPADIVLRTGSSDAFIYEPVQLKELTPSDVDPTQTIAGIVDAACLKYPSERGLSLAINLNRDCLTKLGQLAQPRCNNLHFWFFGICDRNTGFLVKDPFGEATVFEFSLPRLPGSLTQL